MINTAADFNSALQYVMTDIEPDTIKFSNEMSAATFNTVFLDIEKQINILYQKTRLLEDIRDYTELFVTKAVDEKRTAIIENVNAIEMIYDDFVNKDSITEAVIIDPKYVVQDRDGTLVDQFEIINNLLVMPGKVLSSETVVDIVGLDQTSSQIAPFSEADSDRLYCQVYESDEPANSELTASYDILLTGKTKCNFLNFAPVGCDVVAVTLTDPSGNKVDVNPVDFYTDPLRIAKATVTVKTKLINKETVDYPRNDDNDSFDTALEGSVVYGSD